MELKEVYRQIRKKHLYTQQEVALRTGLTRQSICDFENGRTKSNDVATFYLSIADEEDIQNILNIYRERGNYGNINKIN